MARLCKQVVWDFLKVFVCCELYVKFASGQNNQGDVYYGQNNPYQTYNPPEPGDRDYRTFTYNNRRYSQYQPNTYYNSRGQPGDPRRVNQDPRFKYDQQGNQEPIYPGVLGGWREDLQGKMRPDSIIKERDVFVRTRHGEVQGFKVYLYDNPDPDSLYRPGSESIEREMGKTIVFLGIPYAMPPINEGRFRPPKSHKGWQLIQATDFGPACPQPIKYTGASKGVRDMDEDCLYLNIFTPTIGSVAEKLPVMFYIHGGDFTHGASNLFPGHILATFYEVVVVTINYRLGALGFLSTGDINSPGNYGILDQAMALQWVYDNIEFFNGNRDKITLFGPGAGAASAGLLMVAPQTRHIVTKVIAQSGSALADAAFVIDKYRAQNTSRVFGQLLGCSIESSWKLVNCMKQGRSFYELGNAEFPPQVGFFPWGPVIDMNVTVPYYEGWYEKDWHFIKDLPENLIRKGQFNRGLQYMAGVTLQEAAYFVSENSSLAPDFRITREFFDQKIREFVLRYNYTLNPNGTYEAIKYMYTYWPDPNNETLIRDQYINMLSDFLYVAPNDKMVKLLIEQDVPVYMYVLNTTVESFNLPHWARIPHDIEHYLLCGAPFMDVEFFPPKLRFTRNQWTNNDRNMSHFFMKAYSDFARYGNPSHTQILGLHFELATMGQIKYLNINTTYNSTILWNYRQTESAFWSQYLPTVVGHLVPTYPPTTEFWWEPREPLQIAFWSMSAGCLFLIVLVVVCCMLWRNAKRQSDRYYNGELFLQENDPDSGVDNARGAEMTESAASLKEPTSEGRKGTPLMTTRKVSKSKTQLIQGVPQTDV
ncbi:neuroligin-4, Y-linked isoform X2 [Agrilus planipennis]|uniref:Neuroligin-4, Y-linked isoform X2 n=1 Tax=Agrilus planipennis TaxID=224129 RepID=A0A1W4WZQ5_AGRPL|nr:neuroligin-4, Y-linked isoform X2 [Agrilus planipennis]